VDFEPRIGEGEEGDEALADSASSAQGADVDLDVGGAYWRGEGGGWVGDHDTRVRELCAMSTGNPTST
jgi:hypothetical protein